MGIFVIPKSQTLRFVQNPNFVPIPVSQIIYSENFKGIWVNDGNEWANRPSNWANYCVPMGENYGYLEKTATGCKCHLNRDLSAENNIAGIDSSSYLPRGSLYANTNYQLTFTIILSSNKASVTVNWLKEIGMVPIPLIITSGTYSYQFTTNTAIIPAGQMRFYLTPSSNWSSGDGEVWCEIQNITIEKLS